MTQYIFTSELERQNMITFLQSQSNYQNAGVIGGRKIITNFNHASQQEKDDFCDVLADKGVTVVYIDGIETNLLQKYKYLSADSLIYTSELSIQKTNIGTTFVDLYNDYGGRNFFIDLSGFDKIRYNINLNINGSVGTINFRIVDNATLTNVLLDIVVTNNQNHGNVVIPDPSYKNFRGRVRIQVKSTNANDDPIFDRIILNAIRKNYNT